MIIQYITKVVTDNPFDSAYYLEASTKPGMYLRLKEFVNSLFDNTLVKRTSVSYDMHIVTDDGTEYEFDHGIYEP